MPIFRKPCLPRNRLARRRENSRVGATPGFRRTHPLGIPACRSRRRPIPSIPNRWPTEPRRRPPSWPGLRRPAPKPIAFGELTSDSPLKPKESRVEPPRGGWPRSRLNVLGPHQPPAPPAFLLSLSLPSSVPSRTCTGPAGPKPPCNRPRHSCNSRSQSPSG